MTWNYRKRIKIAPGVQLNLSKGGISTSIGPKGAKMTFGKTGTYLHTSIPGTGLYSRKKLSVNTTMPSSGHVMSCKEGSSSINGILIIMAIIILIIGILFIILNK